MTWVQIHTQTGAASGYDSSASSFARYKAKVFTRDGNKCMWCSKIGNDLVLTEFLPGCGPRKGRNLIASCTACDEARNGARAIDWLMLSVDKGHTVRWKLFDETLTAIHRKGIDVYNTRDQLKTFYMPRFENESTSCGRRRRIMLRDGNGCAWCSEQFPAYSPKSTVEHLLPVGKGGPSGHYNAVIACDDCNNERGSRPVSDWIAYCELRNMQVRYKPIVLALLRVKNKEGRCSQWADEQLSSLSPHIRYKYDSEFATEQDRLEVSAETAFELAYASY